MSADLDRTFAALADPVRRGVVDLLRKRPRRAGELADAFGMSAPAMSRHLRVLRRTGLIKDAAVAHDARIRMYQLEPAPFTELREWVTSVEAFWDAQLDSFKAHAERVAKKRR